MSHPIIHIELSATDHTEAGRWYNEIFGWPMTEFPELTYTTFESGEGSPGGGFNPVSEQYAAGTVTFYIQTDDLAAHMQRIAAAGGTVLMEAQQVPGVGIIGLFQDPTGNMIGLLQPAEQ